MVYLILIRHETIQKLLVVSNFDIKLIGGTIHYTFALTWRHTAICNAEQNA